MGPHRTRARPSRQPRIRRFLPIGGILIRVASFTNTIWVHAALQALGLVLYISAFGLGVYLATQARVLSAAHPVIGILLAVLVVGQPASGLLHHKLFKKYGHRTLWSYLHLWNGRAAIVLGMVNGGLGLALARAGRSSLVAYAVVAGIVGVVYIAAGFVGGRWKQRRLAEREKGPRRHRAHDVSSSQADRPEVEKEYGASGWMPSRG